MVSRQVNNATQSLRVAASLLAWLDERGRDLTTCTQGDLDQWFATPPATRAHASAFVAWAVTTGRTPTLSVPKRRHQGAPVLDDTERLDILGQLLRPDTGTLGRRVAAMLLVLFAQPFTKIAALSVDDVVRDGDTIGIRLGRGIATVPSPYAAMLAQLRDRRPNLNTANGPTSPWLFPGRRAGSHLRPSTLRSQVMAMGINLLAARNAALRTLVMSCPPPVVAETLGYSYQAIDRHARRAGSPYSAYAALRAEISPPPEGTQ